MHQHLHYRGLRRRREKGEENIFEEIIAENFPNMGKERVNPGTGIVNPDKSGKRIESHIG